MHLANKQGRNWLLFFPQCPLNLMSVKRVELNRVQQEASIIDK